MTIDEPCCSGHGYDVLSSYICIQYVPPRNPRYPLVAPVSPRTVCVYNFFFYNIKASSLVVSGHALDINMYVIGKNMTYIQYVALDS